MFKIVKDIKLDPVTIKRLKSFCRYSSYEVPYGGSIYSLYVDTVVMSARYVSPTAALT